MNRNAATVRATVRLPLRRPDVRRLSAHTVTLRSRLVLLVLSVLLPAVVITLWLVLRTYDSERIANENTLRETTRALANLIDRELAQRASVARALSLLSELDAAPDLDSPTLAGFEQQVRRALGGMEGWVELHLPPGSAALALPTDPRVLRLLPSEERVPNPRVLPLQPGVAATDTAGGELRAGLLHPVMRDGSVRMNLAVTILATEVQRTLDEQRLPAHWTGAVLDSAGTVVARQPGGQAHAGRSATPDLQRHMASRREGLFDSVTLDGTAVVAYHSTAANGWTFVSAMPREHFAGLMPRAVRDVALASLLALAVALAGALWVARRIAASVHVLERAATDLQAGRPVERRTSGLQEFDDVAATLADASESLRHSRADLERQVAEAVQLTRDAEQRQAQGQRVEALGRLTGGVAHDFNNLLGVISNSAYLIERHARMQPELVAPVAAVLRAVDLGSRLTQHLVRFAGRRPVRPEAVQLVRFLPEMQELLAAALGKRVRLSTEVAPGTWPVVVDVSEFELALMSLALNARDAIVGHGQLSLQARNATPEDGPGLSPGRYVLVTVNDDGEGVDDDTVRHAFEPFFTLGKGVGLGLPQVHGFAVQAGGTASFHSAPGLGTTVSLLLPAAAELPEADASAPAQAAERAAERRSAPAVALEGVRLLLVEDNRELGDATANMLQTHGASVARADNASQALHWLASGTAVDAVLSDVVMPGEMDGLALAQALRVLQPRLPVVLISGHSHALADSRGFPVLRKPCAPQDLVAALADVVRPTT